MSPPPNSFDLSDSWPSGKAYDTAQICLQGHCINDSVTTYPRFNEDYCSRCGQPTMTACRHCRAPIRGHMYQSTATGSYVVPSFCHECGAAYPWTEARLVKAKEAVGALEALSTDERNLAAKLIDDAVRGGSKARQAAARLRKLVTKAGDEPTDRLWAMLTEIADEAGKQALS